MSTRTTSHEMPSIKIDKGTVYVTVAELEGGETHVINYRPQGTCNPEAEIKRLGINTVVKHIKDCHGKGRDEGTIFEVTLSNKSDHLLELSAGQVFVPSAVKADFIHSVKARVKIGGIHGSGAKIKRKMLLGAEAESVKKGDSQGINILVNVNAGGVDFL